MKMLKATNLSWLRPANSLSDHSSLQGIILKET